MKHDDTSSNERKKRLLYLYGVIVILLLCIPVITMITASHSFDVNQREGIPIDELNLNTDFFEPIEGVILYKMVDPVSTIVSEGSGGRTGGLASATGGDHKYYYAYKLNNQWVMDSEIFIFRSIAASDVIDFLPYEEGKIQKLERHFEENIMHFKGREGIALKRQINDLEYSETCLKIHRRDGRHYLIGKSEDKVLDNLIHEVILGNLKPYEIESFLQHLNNCRGYQRVVVWKDIDHPDKTTIMRLDLRAETAHPEAQKIRNQHKEN